MKSLRSNLPLVVVGVIGIALLIGLPLVLDLYTLLQVTLYVIFAILVLSLAFIWGYGGILCFGHSVFFGLGAYGFGLMMQKTGVPSADISSAS